jgi:hypothetical protein
MSLVKNNNNKTQISIIINTTPSTKQQKQANNINVIETTTVTAPTCILTMLIPFRLGNLSLSTTKKEISKTDQDSFRALSVVVNKGLHQIHVLEID